MKIANPTKATLALAAMIMLTVLMATHAIAAEAGTGLIGSIVGYIIGNGVGSKQGAIPDRLIEVVSE